MSDQTPPPAAVPLSQQSVNEIVEQASGDSRVCCAEIAVYTFFDGDAHRRDLIALARSHAALLSEVEALRADRDNLQSLLCGAVRGPYVCNRRPGHKGLHGQTYPSGAGVAWKHSDAARSTPPETPANG